MTTEANTHNVANLGKFVHKFASIELRFIDRSKWILRNEPSVCRDEANGPNRPFNFVCDSVLCQVDRSPGGQADGSIRWPIVCFCFVDVAAGQVQAGGGVNSADRQRERQLAVESNGPAGRRKWLRRVDWLFARQ